MTSSDVDISGLNRAEVAVLWAVVRVGGDPELADGLEPGAVEWLRPALEAATGLEADRREELAGEWRESEISDVLRSDDPAHFDVLLEMEAGELRRLAGDFGAYQLVALLREKNRRRAVRVTAKLGERRQQLLVEALDRDYEASRVERKRIRGGFVALGRYARTFPERVARLGLYSIAWAAGTRYRRRVDELSDRLPRKLADELLRYYRRAQSSSRRGAGRYFREALERFLEWETPDGGEDDPEENEGE